MHSLKQDFQHGIRLLRKTPLLAAIIVVTLGIGIGINTIAFSWVSAVLYHPLRGVDTDVSQLVVVLQKNRFGEDGHEISYLEMQDLAAHREISPERQATINASSTCARMAKMIGSGPRLSLPDSSIFMESSLNFGRCFSTEEAVPGKAPVVVISHKLWKNRFGLDPKILEKVVELNRSSYTIVGICPLPNSKEAKQG